MLLLTKSADVLATKTCSLGLELKTVGDAGVIEGYASAFGVVDSVGDMVVAGAFKASIADQEGRARAEDAVAARSPKADRHLG
jgi:phage head maturation protease